MRTENATVSIFCTLNSFSYDRICWGWSVTWLVSCDLCYGRLWFSISHWLSLHDKKMSDVVISLIDEYLSKHDKLHLDVWCISLSFDVQKMGLLIGSWSTIVHIINLEGMFKYIPVTFHSLCFFKEHKLLVTFDIPTKSLFPALEVDGTIHVAKVSVESVWIMILNTLNFRRSSQWALTLLNMLSSYMLVNYHKI